MAWSRFVELYTPLIYYWARNCGLQAQDAADLVQDVLTLLVDKLPDFQYDRTRSFRGWLRTVTLNKWRERFRKNAVAVVATSQSELGNIPEPNEVEAFWETEYRQQLVERALQLMEHEFTDTTWRACREYVMEGRPAAEVAKELGMSVWTVYAAKSRLINRLRQELDGLLD